MITFRPVRGGFDESIRDSKNFYSFDELLRYLLCDDYFRLRRAYVPDLNSYIRFDPVGFDERLNALTIIVLRKDKTDNKFYPIGYIW